MPEAGMWWYELDAQDRITAVGGEWDEFALRNGAPQALEAHVLGQPLWSFIEGIETTHLLERIVRGVRITGAAVEVPFRCDGPAVQRHMHFHAAPVEGGRVRITTRLVFEEPVDVPATVQSAVPVAGDEAMLTMCSWCNRIRMADGNWLPLADAAARLELFSGARMPAITHGLCHPCLDSMQSLLDDEQQAR